MRRLYVILLFLMFFCVSMLFALPENDVVNQSEVRTVKSSLRNYFWDFEDGLQGWTHTNGQPFPCGWDVEPAMLHTNANSPDPGDSSMWVDSDACGSGYTIWDTCYSPVVVPPTNMAWLKWGCGYQNYAAIDWFTVGIQSFSGGAWNAPVELRFYNTDIGPDIWDSVDVSAYQGEDSIRVFFSYNNGDYTWFASFDNVKLYVPLDHDVGCAGIVSPPVGAMPAGNYDIIARICNYGSFSETFDVTAQVWDTTGGVWIEIFNQTVTLTNFPVGGDSLVNFGTVAFGDSSYFYILVCTMLSGDQDPSNDCCSSGSRTALAISDVIFELDVQTPTGDNQCLGVEFDGTYFYVTGGNSGSDPNKVYVVDTTGTLIWTMDQPAHSTGWGWRDLAWDDVYSGPDRIDTLYTCVDMNMDEFGIDLTNGWLNYYGGASLPVSSCRALAYMPDSQWFFTASFDSIYRFSKINPIVVSVPNPGYSMYGAAYDPGVPGVEGPWIWWHSKDDLGGGWLGAVEQFDPLTMTFTGFNFGYMPTITVPVAAAGLCFYEGFNGYDFLFALVQGDPVDAIIGLYVRVHVDVAEKIEKKIPMVFGFSNIVPNPVRNGKTTVSYTTTRTSPVSLKVYDSAGRLVRTLVDRNEDAGVKTVYWDGMDNNHRPVSAGVYFCRLIAEGKTATNKMVIVR